MRSDALQAGEDLEEPNILSVFKEIEANGLLDALVPRIFTTGDEPVLHQVDG